MAGQLKGKFKGASIKIGSSGTSGGWMSAD
jgi:hypothetical protein